MSIQVRWEYSPTPDLLAEEWPHHPTLCAGWTHGGVRGWEGDKPPATSGDAPSRWLWAGDEGTPEASSVRTCQSGWQAGPNGNCPHSALV